MCVGGLQRCRLLMQRMSYLLGFALPYLLLGLGNVIVVNHPWECWGQRQIAPFARRIVMCLLFW